VTRVSVPAWLAGRRLIGVAGVIILLCAPPLQLVSHAAFFALWYTGVTLTGVYVVLDLRARNRR
jgi:hypothetical protein